MDNSRINILIADDDKNTRRIFGVILKFKGYNVEEAATGAEAISQSRKKFFNIVMVDARLPDASGLEVLKAISEINEDSAVIMVTGYASPELSIEAMNKGAYSCLTKPINMEQTLLIIEKALEKQMLLMENKRLKK